nr:unnamed protein product [Callosobruchus chinensis]
MTTKKKDLEIIYSLQWKNKLGNGSDKANIIGMYDIPATTLNWEVFKSYLLKNSGTVGDDVRVSYITDSNREFPIESQTDFQIALYAFRRKARMGDIVNLKLDGIFAEQSSTKKVRLSSDVETQFDSNEAFSLSSTFCNSESPPDWFISYMNQFKKTVTDEVVASVTNIVSNIKPQTVSQPLCYHSRKSKGESSKQRIRKLQPLIGDNTHDAKGIVKSLKLEGKMERKLKKLEHEAKKHESKMAKLLKSSDSDVGGQSSGGHSRGKRDDDDSAVLQMDAAPVETQTSIPHMLGGEIYKHQWKVKNTGKLCWTSKTVLKFTWGSRALRPSKSVVSVPYLIPGQVGMISVGLRIPSPSTSQPCNYTFDMNSEYSNLRSEPEADVSDIGSDKHTYDKLVRDISVRVGDIKLQDPTDTNCSSDSDNQSVISLAGSYDSKELKDDFVVVPIPDCFKVDTPTTEVKEENVPKQEGVGTSQGSASSNCDDNNNGADIDHNFAESSNKADSISDTKSVSDIKSDIVVKMTLPRKMIKAEYLENAKEISRSQENILTRTNSATSSIEIVNKDDKADRHEQPVLKTSQPGGSTFNIQKNVSTGNPENPQAESVILEFPESQSTSHCSAVGSCFSETSTISNSTRHGVGNISQTVEENSRWHHPLEVGQIPQMVEDISTWHHTGGDRRDSNSSTNNQGAPAPQTFPEMVTPLVTPLVASTLNAASSAISTARSVINRVLPNEQPQPSAPVPNETSSQQRPGYWLNGHWVSTNPNATREANLQALAEMGFWNRDLNATLLARYDDDLSKVVAELVH